MADTHNEKGVMTRYPVTSGLGADDKHEGRQINLVPTGHLGVTSTVRKDFKEGME